MNESLATKVQNRLQMSEDREALQAGLGPLGQKYVEAGGMMFGNKRFDMDDADNIIDDVRYAGTPGLYKLIFKRIPDDLLYTKYDMNKYKSMLLATNTSAQIQASFTGLIIEQQGI
ncbi:hypothetical protein G5I_03090 [Acromyrmex echinatior]|uniref:DUF8207 domain-containing protein n=1 Tax=Acromyrmex echinatior TaxID=103372 RepID=F4WC18_ACREC|nr:hypothetical protein G5I_03090 [Acromyrmex echinatior]